MTRYAVSDWVDAAESIMRNGGGTFDRDGQPVTREGGYFVGGAGESEVIREDSIPTLGALAARLARFKAINGKDFSVRSTHYVGAWASGGLLYLDVSEWVPDFKQAVALAVYRKEQAIWDVAAGKEVSTLPAHVGIEEAYRAVAD